MPDFRTTQESNLFKVWIQRLKTVYTNFEQKMTDHVSGQLALGRSRTDIVAELKDNLANNQSIFKELLGSVEREMDWGLNLEYQVSSNVPTKALPPGSELVKWTLEPAAEHCDSCLYQAGLPARDIATIPIPGSQPTSGETNCTQWCKCTLEPVVELNLEAA